MPPTDLKLAVTNADALPPASVLARLAQALGTARQLVDVFRALRAYVESVTGNNALFVSLLNPAEQVRRCVYAWSDGAEVDVTDLPPLPLSGDTPHARAVATGEVVVVTDLQPVIANTPNVPLGYDRDPRHPNVAVALPLAVLGRVIGGFEIQLFEHEDPRSSIPSLQVAANLAAAAIENVRFLEQERDLRLLAEASERRYRTSEQRLWLALEAAGLGTWEHHLGTGAFSWSSGTERLFGQPAEQQPHLWSELLDLVHPDDRALVDSSLGTSMHNVTREVEFRVVDADGVTLWLAGRARATADAAGGARRILGVVLNVTERKQAERQRAALTHSEQLRALGQMASGIAHDLNQKLALIAGYGELASEKLAGGSVEPEAVAPLVAVIVRAAQDGARTLQQLLSFARAHQPEEVEPLDLAELLREVAELTAPRWRGSTDSGRRINLELAVPAATAMVIEGSRSALREAFTNLIFNAVDALADGGTIRLTAVQVGDRILAEVSDTGPGIPADLQARIFEPFFTTKGEHGTGLGLAQVAGVVDRHGGELTLDSAPDRGTTFRLSFPVAQHLVAELAPETPVPQVAARPRRVLAVDDEPKLRAMIDAMLRLQGHEVIQAASAEEALQLIEESDPFDLVITDVSMGPGMSGWDLADRVHERWPALPLALVSGWGAQIDREEAQRRGVAFVLAKPYRMADLRNMVSSVSQAADAPVPESRRPSATSACDAV
jgi:PAS domain S-box-containing protein